MADDELNAAGVEKAAQYVDLKTLGRGAQGVVVMSHHKDNPDVLFAQKKIDVVGMMESKDIKRTMAEICILAALEHPFIVRYYDSFLNGNELNIITEYAGELNLGTKIKLQKRSRAFFTHDVILGWVTQLLLGVKHIHDRKILHRDLKPENVIVSPENTLKITDFGLSTCLRKTDEMASTMVGTAMYISPELCENKPYNAKTDIWSIGAIFYEIVSLQKAFNAKNMVKLVQMICSAPLPKLDPKNNHPPLFQNILDRMLERNLDARPGANQLFQLHPELQAKGRELMGKNFFRNEFSHTVLHDDGARSPALKMTMMQTVQFPQGEAGASIPEDAGPEVGQGDGAFDDLKRLYVGRTATEGNNPDDVEEGLDSIEHLRNKSSASPKNGGDKDKAKSKKSGANKSALSAMKKDLRARN